MAPASSPGNSLAEWLAKVIELGCDGLEVEHKGEYDEITAMKGIVGFGLRDVKSDSPEAAALRDELRLLRNRTKRIEIGGTAYKARVTTFESFGETAYRVKIL